MRIPERDSSAVLSFDEAKRETRRKELLENVLHYFSGECKLGELPYDLTETEIVSFSMDGFVVEVLAPKGWWGTHKVSVDRERSGGNRLVLAFNEYSSAPYDTLVVAGFPTGEKTYFSVDAERGSKRQSLALAVAAGGFIWPDAQEGEVAGSNLVLFAGFSVCNDQGRAFGGLVG